jgi:hypothetical protein
MCDPVMDANGHTFERSAIERFLVNRPGMCPLTNERYPNGDARLTPNRAVRMMIDAFNEATVPSTSSAAAGGAGFLFGASAPASSAVAEGTAPATSTPASSSAAAGGAGFAFGSSAPAPSAVAGGAGFSLGGAVPTSSVAGEPFAFPHVASIACCDNTFFKHDPIVETDCRDLGSHYRC